MTFCRVLFWLSLSLGSGCSPSGTDCLYPLGVLSLLLVIPVIVIMQRIPFYWRSDESVMIARMNVVAP